MVKVNLATSVEEQLRQYNEAMFHKYGLRREKLHEALPLTGRELPIKLIPIRPDVIDPEVESFSIGHNLADALNGALSLYLKVHVILLTQKYIKFYHTLEDDGMVRIYTKADRDFDYHKMNKRFPLLFPVDKGEKQPHEETE